MRITAAIDKSFLNRKTDNPNNKQPNHLRFASDTTNKVATRLSDIAVHVTISEVYDKSVGRDDEGNG